MSYVQLRAFIVFMLLSSMSVFADEGHEHPSSGGSTSVGGGGDSSLSAAAASMPANLLAGTSFESIAAQSQQRPQLVDPIMVEGNGAGVLSAEQQIGKPGEPMKRRPASTTTDSHRHGPHSH